MKPWVTFLLELLVLTGMSSCSTSEKQSYVTPKETPTPPMERDILPKSSVNWIGHWLGQDKRETLVREVAREFEFLNPEIEVNLKFPQEIFGNRSKALIAKQYADRIRKDNLDWDVIWMDPGIYQLVAQDLGDAEWGKKYLVNFEEVEGFKETQKPFILEDPIYRNQTGGILIGPYIEGFYWALFYNTEVAKRIGIEIKQEGMTFDDLLGYVKKVYEYKQKNNVDIAAFYEARDAFSLGVLFQSLVTSELKDFRKVKEEVTSEEKRAALLKTFRAFEELGKYDPLIPSHANNLWFETKHLALEGKVLFQIGGTWMYNTWRQISEDKMKKMIPAELPVFQEVNYYPGGYIPTWAVFKDAPHRDNGIKLLLFWSTPKVAEKWVRYTKSPTGLRGHFSTPEIGVDVFEKFQHRITTKYGKNVLAVSNAGYLLGKENRLLLKDIAEKIIKLLEGRTTAETAYHEIIVKAGLEKN
jgi:ABC-type glycerol-3-phosphate transport system substrate-binding protein